MLTINQRRLALLSVFVFVSLLITLIFGVPGQAVEPPLLDPVNHPKFVNPLPLPARIDATHGGSYKMGMRAVTQWLGLVDGENNHLMTNLWGYGLGRNVTYPGPTFLAQKDVPVSVRWENLLPNAPHLLPVDFSIHMAMPMRRAYERGGIPTVVHLHGGHTEAASDGHPEAWFTQRWADKGPTWEKATYTYDNSQEAATLWYHDHALGITRLNVYAGLAGFYLLRDENENELIEEGVLPSGAQEIEMVFQDRMFTADGQLFFPSDNPELAEGFPPPPSPTIIAEFFGDFILVNGAAWPVLEVEPRKYRFRLLNGSDSRAYIFKMDNGMSFMQVGTDDGLLPTPVALNQLLLMPGERADIVVDFSGFDPNEAPEIVMQNIGPDGPFMGFDEFGVVIDGPADPATTGQVMKFRVNKPLSGPPYATVDTSTELRPAIQPLVQTGATRRLGLFEGLDEYGRLEPMLGIVDPVVDPNNPNEMLQGSMSWFQSVTENPMLNDVEVWEVYNNTGDVHPIHLHLVAFQVINRESFTATITEKPQPQHMGGIGVGAVMSDVVLGGDPTPPADNEKGWKDTIPAYPGTVTRVIAKFDRVGQYVWHCHILSHEDHDMMRPYEVLAPGIGEE